MNEKDKSWLFILLLILAVNGAEVFFRKGQTISGILLIILGLIFFTLFLIFHFKKKDGPGILSTKKKFIIIISTLLISRLLLNALVPVKPKIDQKKMEAKIQTLLKEQEELSKQVGELQQEEKIEEAEKKVKKIEENINKALELNQTLINNASSKDQKENLLKRQEVLEIGLIIFNGIEKCMSFYPDDMDIFNNCQKEIEEIIKTTTPADKQ